MADLDALWAAHREARDRERRRGELEARLAQARREFGEARSRCHELRARLDRAAAELARTSGVRGLVLALGGARHRRRTLASEAADLCRAELDAADQTADGLLGEVAAIEAQLASLGTPADADRARAALIAALDATGDPRAAEARRLSAELDRSEREVAALRDVLETARVARGALLDASRRLEAADRGARGSRARQLFALGARQVHGGLARSAAQHARDALARLAEQLAGLPEALRSGIDVTEHSRLNAGADWRPGDPERSLGWVDGLVVLLDERWTAARDERDAAAAARDALLD